MGREVLVFLDQDDGPIQVGTLWARSRSGRDSASFEYTRDWLHHPARFSLEPALQLGPGPFHTETGKALFGAIGDSAPDRWGRTLMRRAERRRANTDDHLRNHGFLHDGIAGWRLSPAYDLNPVPVDVKPRILSTNIDLDDAAASLELAMEVSGYFDLNPARARQIAVEVGRAVATWRQVAAGLGLEAAEIERMESAFEHDDLRAALS